MNIPADDCCFSGVGESIALDPDVGAVEIGEGEVLEKECAVREASCFFSVVIFSFCLVDRAEK